MVLAPPCIGWPTGFRAAAPRGTVVAVARRISRRGKHLLDLLHFVTSIGWLGVGLCQLTLNVIALVTDDPALRHAAHEIGHVFDRYLLIALATGSVVTGVLLGLKTRWGLLLYRWVVVKLALTAALLVFTPIWMGGWIGEAVALTRPPSPSDDPAYLLVRSELLVGSVTIVSTLLVVTVISVVKPWGRLRREPRGTALP